MIAILLLAGATTVRAQHQVSSDVTEGPWWVALDAGVNLHGHDGGLRAGGLLGFEVGWWKTPVWGFSARMSMFDAKGLAAMGTVTVDWTNFDGEIPGGWHIYTPLSLGAGVIWGEGRARGTIALAVAGGVRYVCGPFVPFAELGMMALGENIDWPEEEGFDLTPSFSVGVRYSLPTSKVRHYTPGSRQSEVTVVVPEKGSDPRGLVDDMVLVNERLHLPATVITFPYDGSTLDDNALRQLNLFVSQMKASGKEAEFYVFGSADNVKESQSHNRKLCERRCLAVYEALVKNFGVDGNRLKVLPGGGYSEYAHQYTERTVMVILRTPATEEVVERWVPTY